MTTYALGRLVQHDERSRDYAFRVAAAKPETVLWEHTAPVLDQGEIGMCTCTALAQWLNTDFGQERRSGLLTIDDATKLYELATRLDGIPGVWPPMDTGSSGIAACKAGRKLGYLSAYHHAFGFHALLMALQHSPVIVGTAWTKGMFTPDARGVIRPAGPIAGGHEYLILGCDVDLERLTILNSWSASWGRNGRAFIGFADFEALLSDRGDATVPIV